MRLPTHSTDWWSQKKTCIKSNGGNYSPTHSIPKEGININISVSKLPGGKINQVSQPIPKAGTSQGGNGPIVPLLETVAQNKTLVLNQIQMVKTSNKRFL